MKRGVCRAVARRVHVRAATAARANRVIAALNSIFSGRRIGLDVSCVRCLEDLPQNQQEAIRGILRAVRQLDKPPMHVTGLEALKALRAASATYEDVGTGVGDVVSLDLGSLSLPDECGDGVSLQDAVEGCDIRDCFYAVRVEDKLSDYFCLMQDEAASSLFKTLGGTLALQAFAAGRLGATKDVMAPATFGHYERSHILGLLLLVWRLR